MYDVVQSIAREAGEIALRHFGRSPEGFVESKGHLDLVTEADRAVEQFIVGELAAAFPADGIFGEEGSARSGTSGRTWVVDPIDGTFNFVRGGDQWAVSIGLFANDRPAYGVTYAPVRNDLLAGGGDQAATLNGIRLKALPPFAPGIGLVGVGFHPVIPISDRLRALNIIFSDVKVDIRASGAATISLFEVATGLTDGYIGSGISSWDVMAMVAILETIGVHCNIDWKATDLASKLQFICGTPGFLRALPRDLLQPL